MATLQNLEKLYIETKNKILTVISVVFINYILAWWQCIVYLSFIISHCWC